MTNGALPLPTIHLTKTGTLPQTHTTLPMCGQLSSALASSTA
jgi:hypothetical protein